MLDESVFAKNMDDIEDQLDLMNLADFVYSKPADVWSEYPRYLKALVLRLERLPNNLQRDDAAIVQIDPWMDKLFKFKNDSRLKELYFYGGRIAHLVILAANEDQDANFAKPATKSMGKAGNRLR